MTITEYEDVIMKDYAIRVNKCENTDSLNKLYRQARIWNRLHYFFGQACSYERYREINEFFKLTRANRRFHLISGQTHG